MTADSKEQPPSGDTASDRRRRRRSWCGLARRTCRGRPSESRWTCGTRTPRAWHLSPRGVGPRGARAPHGRKTDFGLKCNLKTHFGFKCEFKTHFGFKCNLKTPFGYKINLRTHAVSPCQGTAQVQLRAAGGGGARGGRGGAARGARRRVRGRLLVSHGREWCVRSHSLREISQLADPCFRHCCADPRTNDLRTNDLRTATARRRAPGGRALPGTRARRVTDAPCLCAAPMFDRAVNLVGSIHHFAPGVRAAAPPRAPRHAAHACAS
jgi:hypothetical protein